MPSQPVGRRIEHARCNADGLGIVVETSASYTGILAIGGKPAVAIRAQPHALLGCGAMGSLEKHLRTRHCYLDRSAQHPGADRGECRIDVVGQLASESAADV